jgi:protein-disulfide isomerase
MSKKSQLRATPSANPARHDFPSLRAMRRRQQRRNLVIGLAAVVLIVVIAIALNAASQSARQQADRQATNTAALSNLIEITPYPHPSAEGTAMGDPNAPVRIDVYEDFQCPACVNYSKIVEKSIIEAYVATGKVYYTYHHYPFLDDRSATKESDQAANASMCAAEQGRFWDYHDMLFANWNGENEGAFNDLRLEAFAEKLGLDMAAFQSCFQENRYKAQIEADYQEGLARGVSGTPSVFVGDTQVAPGYVPTFEQIQQEVEAALAGK